MAGAIALLSNPATSYSNSNLKSRSTSGFTPTAGRILRACCVVRKQATGSPAPVISATIGHGGTWLAPLSATISDSASNRTTFAAFSWKVPADVSGSPAALTWSTGLDFCDRWNWHIWEEDAIAFEADNLVAFYTSTKTGTLPFAPAADSRVTFCVACVGYSGDITAPSPWVELGDTGTINATPVQVAYHNGPSPPTALTWSVLDTSNLIIGFESKVAVASFAATGSATLPALQGAGSATVSTGNVAVGAGSFAALTGSGSAALAHAATGGGTFAALQATGTATRSGVTGGVNEQSGFRYVGAKVASDVVQSEAGVGNIAYLAIYPEELNDNRRARAVRSAADALAPAVVGTPSLTVEAAGGSVSLREVVMDPSKSGWEITAVAHTQSPEPADVSIGQNVQSIDIGGIAPNTGDQIVLRVTARNMLPAPIQRDFTFLLNVTVVGNAYTNVYAARRRLVFQGTPENLPAGQVYVVHEQSSELRSVSNGGKVVSELGYDIYFETSEIVQPHEIKYYDPILGELIAWVKMTASRTAGARRLMLMYYGKAGLLVSNANPAATWAAEALKINTVTGVDRSPNGRNLTVNGTIAVAQETLGEIADFSGAGTDYLTQSITNFGAWFSGQNYLCVSFRIKPSVLNSDMGAFCGNPVGTDKDADFFFRLRGIGSFGLSTVTNCVFWGVKTQAGAVRYQSSANALNTDEVTLIHLVWSESTLPRMWIDGVEDIPSWRGWIDYSVASPVLHQNAVLPGTARSLVSVGSFVLGKGPMDTATSGWNGLLGGFRVVTGLPGFLTPEKILEEYRNQVRPPLIYGIGNEELSQDIDLPPVPVPDRFFITTPTAILNVITNDYHPQNKDIHVTDIGEPTRGRATLQDDDTILFEWLETPANPPVEIDYQVMDSSGKTGRGLLEISGPAVSPPPPPPPPPDITPNAFPFTALTGQPVNTDVTSALVTITGITAPAAVTSSGGTVAIKPAGGVQTAFSASPGNVNAGDQVQAKHRTSTLAGTALSSTISIGSPARTETFTSTTTGAAAGDITPNAFSFAAKTAQLLDVDVTSAVAVITGIDTTVNVAVTGGWVKIGSSTSWVTTGTIVHTSLTQTTNIQLKVRTSTANSTKKTVSITVGGRAAVNWDVTTKSAVGTVITVPQLSGFTCNDSNIGGNPSDIETFNTNYNRTNNPCSILQMYTSSSEGPTSTWDNLIHGGKSTLNSLTATAAGTIAWCEANGMYCCISTPMLPDKDPVDPGASQNFDKVIDGTYNSKYDTFFATLKNRIGDQPFMWRLAWEASGYHGCDYTATTAAKFAAAWAHIALRAKTYFGAQIKTNWCSLKSFPSLDAYPGNAACDVIGVDYYDATQISVAGSDDPPTAGRNDGGAHWHWDNYTTKQPRGIYTWAEFARSKGKPLSVDEWGIWHRTDTNSVCKGKSTLKPVGVAGGDNPIYIQQMYNFFHANRDIIFSEIYFLRCPNHLSHAPTNLALAKYKQLWARHWKLDPLP